MRARAIDDRPTRQNILKPHQVTKQPTSNVLYKSNNMSRPETSALIQARTEKIGLKHYLLSIGAEESRECDKVLKPSNMCCYAALSLMSSGNLEEMWEGKRETGNKAMITKLFEVPGLAKKAAQFQSFSSTRASCLSLVTSSTAPKRTSDQPRSAWKSQRRDDTGGRERVHMRHGARRTG